MGCTEPTVVTKYEHLTTPTELRDCGPEPAVGTITSDDQFADYTLAVVAWGESCSNKSTKRNEVEDAVK